MLLFNHIWSEWYKAANGGGGGEREGWGGSAFSVFLRLGFPHKGNKAAIAVLIRVVMVMILTTFKSKTFRSTRNASLETNPRNSKPSKAVKFMFRSFSSSVSVCTTLPNFHFVHPSFWVSVEASLPQGGWIKHWPLWLDSSAPLRPQRWGWDWKF